MGEAYQIHKTQWPAVAGGCVRPWALSVYRGEQDKHPYYREFYKTEAAARVALAVRTWESWKSSNTSRYEEEDDDGAKD